MAFTLEEETILKLMVAETQARFKLAIGREEAMAKVSTEQTTLLTAQTNLKDAFKPK